MKNILYINTTPSGGGAAAVMQRLDHMMHLRGASTHILTGFAGSKQHDDGLQAHSRGGLLSWCLWRGQQDYHIQKSHRLLNNPFFQQADILHFHNLHGGYFNPWSIPLLSALKPTVWTLHDMQALTGHCAYSLDCKRWLPETGCGSCPSLSAYPRLWRDTTRQLWQDKHTIYAHSSLYLVTPSVWLQRLTEKSLLKEQPLVCIPNGADTSVYRSQDQQEARRLLGLPQGALLVGGCADGGLANPWKGGRYVQETVLELKKTFPSLHFLNIGVKSAPEELQNTDWVHHIPYVHEPVQLARLYAALDLLLYPTLADNHPLVCIESLCCGTPIVGFATGGVPEIVRNGLDGLLVPTHDGPALVKAAVTLLQNADLRKKMGQEAAASGARRFNLDLFTNRYEKVYEEVLHMPRSLKKNCLPLSKIPMIIKTPFFIKNNYTLFKPLKKNTTIYILYNILLGFIFQSIIFIPGCCINLLRQVRKTVKKHRAS
ncbi:glycosyltransferase [Desulfovibrio piger]|uniref:Glycosyltransferase n=1 Tax=Desulfovibrio piger TaxID=901 RepID=A0A848CGT3_9BACT|nr:glycosyltransferase [Desulfovibrio piger]NME52724.1 glycosyltransferase [Desulfovibrio piger]